MENISLIGLIISCVVSLLFLIELVLFFASFRRGKRGHLPIHLLGVITTFLVSLCTIATTFSIAIESSFLIKAVIVLAGIFFIVAGINTLIVEKKDTVEKVERVREKINT